MFATCMEGVDGWINGINGCPDGWMDGWTDRQKDNETSDRKTSS